MTPVLQSHLTNEALDDVLIGLGSPASLAHLARCPECRARVEAFQSSIEVFNQASLAFCEAQPLKATPASRPAPRYFTRPVLAAWATAVLLILVSPVAWHLFKPHPVQGPAIATVEQDSETQIADDNELMRQVNAAIEPDDQSVVDQYQLLTGPRSQAHPKMRTE